MVCEGILKGVALPMDQIGGALAQVQPNDSD
jgi:hypothetical protein